MPGDDNDIINVGNTSSSLDNILGVLAVYGQNQSDTLNLNDQGDVNVNNYILTGVQLTRGLVTVNYDTSMENVVLNADGNVSGTTGNVIDVTASLNTKFTIHGNNPVLANGVDRLNYTDGATATKTLNGSGAGTISAPSYQDVVYDGIEAIHGVGTQFVDVVNLPTDGTPNLVQVNVDTDSIGTYLEVWIDLDTTTLPGLVLQSRQLMSDTAWLEVNGSGDADELLVLETADGIPAFTGTAPNSHTNAAYTALGWSPANIGIHFDGNGGTGDTAHIQTITARNVAYLSDTVDTANSGVIAVQNAFALSFEDLSPAVFSGAGGSLLIDASANAGLTLMDISDDLANTAGAGGNMVTGNNLFETAYFAGYGSVTVRSGTGSETVTLYGLDPASTETAITLDGDNITNTDAAADVSAREPARDGHGDPLGRGGADTFDLATSGPRPRDRRPPTRSISSWARSSCRRLATRRARPMYCRSGTRTVRAERRSS